MNPPNPQLLIDWLKLHNTFEGCGCGAVRCTYISKYSTCTVPTNCVAMVFAEAGPDGKKLIKLLEEECKD